MKNKQKYEPSKTYIELLALRKEIATIKNGHKYQKQIVVNKNPHPCTNVMMNIAYELSQPQIDETPTQHIEETMSSVSPNALRFLTKDELETLKKEEVVQQVKKRGRKRKV